MKATSATKPERDAKAAGLRYVSDREPGIRRVRAGKGFHYTRPTGGALRDADALARIRRLAIPPAWNDVWIAPSADAHLQATGRDARGRKQYKYHPRWREARDETKYHRLLSFGRALPRIRARVAKDLRRAGLHRAKVLATIVRLLDTTYMRVGNHEYRRDNRSHGLTTLRDHHARFGLGKVTFRFAGKSGKRHTIDVEDAKLARIVKRCQDLPGQELFQYVDENDEVRNVGSADVNAYLREIAGADFTAKHFRTWAGTVLAAIALREIETYDTAAQLQRNVVAAIERVAQELGNTPAVCRKCYVHPDVLDSYLDGTFVKLIEREATRKAAGKLAPDEAAVLALLLRRLAAAHKGGRLEPTLRASVATARRGRRTSRETARSRT